MPTLSNKIKERIEREAGLTAESYINKKMSSATTRKILYDHFKLMCIDVATSESTKALPLIEALDILIAAIETGGDYGKAIRIGKNTIDNYLNDK